MTPIEVMKLGYMMRKAQKYGFTDTAAELERQFDAAIMPYINHAKNMGEDVDGRK